MIQDEQELWHCTNSPNPSLVLVIQQPYSYTLMGYGLYWLSHGINGNRRSSAGLLIWAPSHWDTHVLEQTQNLPVITPTDICTTDCDTQQKRSLRNATRNWEPAVELCCQPLQRVDRWKGQWCSWLKIGIIKLAKLTIFKKIVKRALNRWILGSLILLAMHETLGPSFRSCRIASYDVVRGCVPQLM